MNRDKFLDTAFRTDVYLATSFRVKVRSSRTIPWVNIFAYPASLGWSRTQCPAEVSEVTVMEHTVHAVGVVYAQDDRGLYESSHPVRDVDV